MDHCAQLKLRRNEGVIISGRTMVWEYRLTPRKVMTKLDRQNIKKQRHYFVNKGPSSQSYGFSSSHVWMRVGL